MRRYPSAECASTLCRIRRPKRCTIELIVTALVLPKQLLEAEDWRIANWGTVGYCPSLSSPFSSRSLDPDANTDPDPKRTPINGTIHVAGGAKYSQRKNHKALATNLHTYCTFPLQRTRREPTSITTSWTPSQATGTVRLAHARQHQEPRSKRRGAKEEAKRIEDWQMPPTPAAADSVDVYLPTLVGFHFCCRLSSLLLFGAVVFNTLLAYRYSA